MHSAILAAVLAASHGPSSSPAAIRANPEPPRIVSLTTSAARVRSGDRFTISVVANSSVSSVTANFANQKMPFAHNRPNTFSFSYTVPWVPFFVKGTYSMRIVASNATGATASRDVQIVLE